MAQDSKLYALIDYEDSYVQPLLLHALQSLLPPELLVLIKDLSELPSTPCSLLQWRQYESIDFDHVMSNGPSSMANSFVIRKALIRKHYLSATVSHWLTKHPNSQLNGHVKPSVEFEVDYAEFLDDALLEAFELKESWQRNEALDDDSHSREWWILKPGMSDRGQGIRLFSSEEELTGIFEAWDPPSDDDEDEGESQASPLNKHDTADTGVIASHLRHFVAQLYIHPPLLLPRQHPSADRKFHVRTYVLAMGALQVYVYKPMLALFAGRPYVRPSATADPNEDLSSHLTNTCLQSGERQGSVHAFWSLPSNVAGVPEDWKESAFQQICNVTGEVFEAAARSMAIHFQPLPNAFELYGLDFLIDAKGTAWLLEVNAFPDFAQTGSDLSNVIRDLFRETVRIAIMSQFGLSCPRTDLEGDGMQRVLNIDLGRR